MSSSDSESRLPRQINWKAVIPAGLIAGLVFVVLEMVLVATLGGGSPWGPPRMMAAIAMGNGVLPPPATFAPGIFIVGMIVHFALSVVLAIILGFIVSRFSMGYAVGTGIVFGLAVYVVNFYGFTAVFPWFAMARNAITIFSHLVFGAVAAWSYKALASRQMSAPTTG